jgi:hypothetical protein
MANIYLSSRTGQTVTSQLYDGATVVGTPISMTEIGTTGEYFCDVTSGTAAGDYLVIFFVGGQSIGSGQLYWDGTSETVPGLESIPNAVLGATVETGATVVESLRLHNSVLGGKVSGGGSGVETFRDLADTKDRLVSTNTATGDRTAEVADLT